MGTVVGSTWNSVHYMRALALSVGNPRTEKQQSQRSKFALTLSFLQAITPYVREGYRNYADRCTAFNAAMSYLLKNAVTGSGPDISIDYAKVMVARGSLTPVFVAVEKHQDPGAGQLAARGLNIPCYFLDDAGGAGTIIGALSRMEAVVSMRLHALIFAAGQGIPLAGVVYDPKVSAFLRYIGQECFTDLSALTEADLREMIDRCMAQRDRPEAQAAAVARLQEMEQKNVEVARRLLG